LNLTVADAGNHRRLQHLADLNKWRNIAAHHAAVPPPGLPSLANVQAWKDSCTGLAASLDGFMYNRLRKTLRRPPWAR
jgi:hypothetical protein